MKIKFKFKIDIDFFKRNPLISSVLLGSFLIIIILVYMIYDESWSKVEADKKLDEMKDKIQVLNSTSPYPSERNIELIKGNIQTLKLKAFKLEDIFGNVYEKPLKAFVEELKKGREGNKEPLTGSKEAEESEEKLKEESKELKLYNFIDSWKIYIEEEKKNKSELALSEIFKNFKKYKNITDEDFDRARKAFLTEFQKLTLEPLNNETIDDYILASLGIPLDFSRIRCKNLVSEIESALNKIMAANNVLVSGGRLLLFNEFDSVPNEDEIPYIIQYCRFAEDFFQRIARSNVESIESYKKLNGLKGYEDSNFLIFSYQVDIVCTMEALRLFLDNLQNAYKENRVYVIKSLTISVMEDGVNNLPPFDSKAPVVQQIKVLLGNSDIVKASIVVNYVIYKKKVF